MVLGFFIKRHLDNEYKRDEYSPNETRAIPITAAYAIVQADNKLKFVDESEIKGLTFYGWHIEGRHIVYRYG
jgi:hypothetical protein